MPQHTSCCPHEIQEPSPQQGHLHTTIWLSGYSIHGGNPAWLDLVTLEIRPLPQLRSLQIEGRPWEQALKQVLSPASWAFTYTRAEGQDRLVQVVVFPSELRPPAEPHGASESAEPAPPQLTMVEPPEGRGEDQAQQEEPVEQEETVAFGQDTQEPQRIPRSSAR